MASRDYIGPNRVHYRHGFTLSGWLPRQDFKILVKAGQILPARRRQLEFP